MSTEGGAPTERRPNLVSRLGGLVGLAVLLGLLTALRFGPWEPHVFFGDDLSNYAAFQDGMLASTPWQALTASYAEKFRPVFAMALGGLFALFGTRIELYMMVNAAINVLSGLIAAAIVLKLTRGRILIAVLAAAAITTSRFLLYQLTQVTGLLEGLGLLLFLGMLLFVVQLHMDERVQVREALVSGLLACLAAWLLIFTHERYLGAAPWLAIMLFVAPGLRSAGAPVRGALALLAIGPLATHFIVKILVLKEAVFVGTGGTHMTLDWPGMVDRFLQALLSVLNFNHGPPYLAAWDVTTSLVSSSGVAAAVFALLLACILVAGVRSRPPRTALVGVQEYLLPFALAVLAGLVLLPPLLTIRMEQRWLVQPFALLILIAAWFAGRMSATWPRAASACFIGLVAMSMIVDWRVSKAFPNIFFVYSERVAENVKRAVIDARPQPEKIAIIAHKDFCNWVLLQGEFFRLYSPRDEATCVNTVSEIDPMLARRPDRPTIFSVAPDYSISDVSAATYDTLAVAAETKRYDFLERIADGKINDPAKIDTPAGLGVFRFDTDAGYGVTPTLTVVIGYTYRYDDVPVLPGDRLNFNAAMVYPTKDSARAVVRIVEPDGATATVADVALPLRPAVGPVKPKTVSVPLDDYVGKVSVIFAVEAPNTDPSAKWVAFDRPRISAATPP